MTHLNFSELNIWAVIVVSVLNMVIGSLWYSKLMFGKAWMRGIGFSDNETGAPPWVFIIVYILGIVIAVVLGLFLQGVDSALAGMGYAALLSLGLVIPTIATHYLMEKRKGYFILIIAGHELVLFLVFGAILGGWQ